MPRFLTMLWKCDSRIGNIWKPKGKGRERYFSFSLKCLEQNLPGFWEYVYPLITAISIALGNLHFLVTTYSLVARWAIVQCPRQHRREWGELHFFLPTACCCQHTISSCTSPGREIKRKGKVWNWIEGSTLIKTWVMNLWNSYFKAQKFSLTSMELAVVHDSLCSANMLLKNSLGIDCELFLAHGLIGLFIFQFFNNC